MTMVIYNIRVYGILINDKNQVLLSDEYVLDRYMTKFPGGGMEPEEGPEDCIRRESQEEFGQEIEIKKHFYTTGFYQPAFFFENQQLISIYYEIELIGENSFKISSKKFDFDKITNGSQSFRWADISELHNEQLTFPVDRYVADLLKQKILK